MYLSSIYISGVLRGHTVWTAPPKENLSIEHAASWYTYVSGLHTCMCMPCVHFLPKRGHQTREGSSSENRTLKSVTPRRLLALRTQQFLTPNGGSAISCSPIPSLDLDTPSCHHQDEKEVGGPFAISEWLLLQGDTGQIPSDSPCAAAYFIFKWICLKTTDALEKHMQGECVFLVAQTLSKLCNSVSH